MGNDWVQGRCRECGRQAWMRLSWVHGICGDCAAENGRRSQRQRFLARVSRDPLWRAQLAELGLQLVPAAADGTAEPARAPR